MNSPFSQIYYSFKQQLLTLMAQTDPLAILESGIFDRFEAQLFPNHPIHHQHYETKITSYQFMDLQQSSVGIAYKMVERRSKSADKYSSMLSSIQQKQRKINRLQEQNKVQFTIWSNILANCFASLPSTNTSAKCELLSSIESQSNRKKNHQLQKQNRGPNNQEHSHKQIINNISHLFGLAHKKCLTNFTPRTLQSTLEILQNKIAREIAYAYECLAQVASQNQRLRKKIEEYSMRELQFIIKQKDDKKQIRRLKKQLQDYYNDHDKQIKQLHASFQTQKNNIFQKLKDFDKNYLFSECNNEGESTRNLTGIEKLRQKIVIDSVRRNMLLGVDREKWEIQMKREELGITRFIGQHLDEQHEEQTLDTDHC